MTDLDYMKIAINNAKKAYDLDEVPIGCVIVRDNVIISSTYIATYHAEILAINEACSKLNTWHLEDCVLYTTVEPCMMCMGAIKQARISRVVYGVDNYAFGYLRKLEDGKLVVKKGILKEECLELLSNFFKSKRKGE